MGPTNVALVKLLKADLALREAQGRLESASRNVTGQSKRIADFTDRLKQTQLKLKEQQSHSANLELDIKMRDERIDKLRTQQAEAKNNKEYQAFLTEINTEKIDKGKTEDELMKSMQLVENSQAEMKALQASLDEAVAQHVTSKEQIGGQLTELQALVDKLVPIRAAAAAAISPGPLAAFERLADRYDGEAITPISKPNRRREEYICTACNRGLVVDIYNRLHTRDELIFCPTCHRMLYIPEDLPPEEAIGTGRPEPKAPSAKAAAGTKRAPRRKASVVNASAAAAAESGEPAAQPVVIEPRAKGKLGELFAKAQAESVSRCIASDSKPLEFDVLVSGEMVGIYKGQNREHLERVIKFFLEEAGLQNEVQVRDRVPEGTPTDASPAAPPVEPTAAPAAEHAADPAATSGPDSLEVTSVETSGTRND